jgi:hypothetical protein
MGKWATIVKMSQNGLQGQFVSKNELFNAKRKQTVDLLRQNVCKKLEW